MSPTWEGDWWGHRVTLTADDECRGPTRSIPAANLRALGEIQQRGLEAAGDLVDRMVKAVDGDGTGDAAPRASRSASTTSDVDRLFDLWADLFRRSVQAMVQPFAQRLHAELHGRGGRRFPWTEALRREQRSD